MNHLLRWKLHAQTGRYLRLLEKTRDTIARSLYSNRNFYVSCSFGKDSSVMLRLILDQAPNIPVLYMSSGYALPDTNVYREQITKLWNLNLTVLASPVDYMDLCQEYGLPHQRTHAVQRKIVKQLKKTIAIQWAQEMEFTGLFWGLRGDESVGRKMLMRCHADGVLDRQNILRVAPLAQWTAQDVWAYITATDMPYNTLYDKENCGFTRETLRNTGWLSTDGEAHGQIEWLRRNYPQHFQKVRELL